MKHFFFICLLISGIGLSFSQAINQFDADGKRHGIWKKTFKDTNVLRYEGAFNHGKEKGFFKFYKKVKGKAVLSATKQFQDDSNRVKVKFFTERGKVISEGEMKEKNYVGTWRYYQKRSNDLLILEHFNNEGKLEGERHVYYKNGQITETQNYKSGVLEGISTYFSEKSIVLKTFIYVNGELHGVSKYYDPNGVLIIEGHYKNGKKHGDWKYYENGSLKEIKNFTTESKYKKAP